MTTETAEQTAEQTTEQTTEQTAEQTFGFSEAVAGLPEEQRGYIENKGIKDFTTLASSFVNAQRLVGADKVALPGPAAEPAAWEPVWNKLGRPEAADGYKYTFPDGVKAEEADLKEFSTEAHKAGLTQQQANVLANYLVGGAHKEAQEAAEKRQADIATAEKALQGEWGDKYKLNTAKADDMARQLGLDAEKVEALRGVMGTPALVQMFYAISTKVGEDSFADPGGPGGGTGPDGSLSPAGAKARIAELRADPTFRAAYFGNNAPGHAEAVARMTRLNQIANPAT